MTFYLQYGLTKGAVSNFGSMAGEPRLFLDSKLHPDNELIKQVEAPTWLEARNKVSEFDIS